MEHTLARLIWVKNWYPAAHVIYFIWYSTALDWALLLISIYLIWQRSVNSSKASDAYLYQKNWIIILIDNDFVRYHSNRCCVNMSKTIFYTMSYSVKIPDFIYLFIIFLTFTSFWFVVSSPCWSREIWFNGVSNYLHIVCLLKRLFRRISKKTSELRLTDLCERESTGDRWIPLTKGQ